MVAAMTAFDPKAIHRRLLRWYDRHRRVLPWRAVPGVIADPYRVWLSEIMLQQTTVAAVEPYYRRFLERWPTLPDLAAATLEDVLRAWAGLGYYARARNLHACARMVATEHGGAFPADETALLKLPGVGPYTAAAIAAITFQRPVLPVDGNIERVVARLFAHRAPLPKAKPGLRALAETLTPRVRPGDVAQALMDLGATLCTPRSPDCPRCPLTSLCRAAAQGIAAELPRRARKAGRPTRHGLAFWLTRDDGAVLLRRRPARGLLGGMTEVPSTPWRPRAWSLNEARAHAPVAATGFRLLPGRVHHVFSHFALELKVATARADGSNEGLWCAPDQLDTQALPSVMRKVATLARFGA